MGEMRGGGRREIFLCRVLCTGFCHGVAMVVICPYFTTSYNPMRLKRFQMLHLSSGRLLHSLPFALPRTSPCNMTTKDSAPARVKKLTPAPSYTLSPTHQL